MNKKIKLGLILGSIGCVVVGSIITTILILNNKNYVVNFESNGGTRINNQMIKRNDKVIKPTDPIKEGYIFKGWYLDGNEYHFTEKVKNNIILRAKWIEQNELEKVTVNFEDNNGSKLNSIVIVKGEKITKPTDPIKEGYVFVGWLFNNNAFNFDTQITSDITLVATWKELEKDTFTVTFNTNGGSNISTQTIKKDEKVIKPTDPIKEGYKFKGWYLNNKKYDFNASITKNIILTAKWTIMENSNNSTNIQNPVETPKLPEAVKYNVVFDSNGGENVDNIEVLENSNITNLPSTKKKDYEFNGWYLDETKFTTTTIISSNITLKAQYTFLNSEKQMHDGYPTPDIAYSYSTAESAQKYLDSLNSLWDSEVIPRLNIGFYSQEEVDNYLIWLDNKAQEYKQILECLPEHKDMCE